MLVLPSLNLLRCPVVSQFVALRNINCLLVALAKFFDRCRLHIISKVQLPQRASTNCICMQTQEIPLCEFILIINSFKVMFLKR